MALAARAILMLSRSRPAHALPRPVPARPAACAGAFIARPRIGYPAAFGQPVAV